MSGRWPIVVGITAALAVVAWVVMRDRGEDSPKSATSNGSASLTSSQPATPATPAPGAGARGIGTGPNPELPAAPSVPPPKTADDAFEAQDRDDRWAPQTEAEIARRFKRLRGAKLAGTECRRDQCRITVTGSEADVGTTIAELEGPHGLHGFASTLRLTVPERKPDGTITLRAFASFER